MTEQSAASIYDQISEQYNREVTTPSNYIGFFIDNLPPNCDVLDIGCGTGVDAIYMDNRGLKVTGIDASLEMLQYARTKSATVNFKQQDIRELDFEEESFDGILAAFSLIHIPKKDIANIFSNLHKTLKQDGILYFSVWLGKSNELFIPEPLNPELQLFINMFSNKEVNRLLKDKFEIIKEFKGEPKEGFNFEKLSIIAKKI